MENLMANQSHLALPVLDKLEEIAGIDSTIEQTEHNSWTNWLHTLYKVLLMHQDVLVKRRSIEFLLKNTKWQNLDKQLQELLLNALNSTDLYNKKGYFLSKTDFQKFFSVYSADLYEVVAKINWKSVPLHYFVENSAKCLEPLSEDLQVFFKLTKCVRKLQNVDIRKDCMRKALEKFDDFRNFDFNLKSFCQVVEAQDIMHSALSSFLITHIEKIMGMCRADKERLEFVLKDFDYFSRHFYDIINPSKNYYYETDAWHIQLLKLLKEIPKKHHGFMCFYPIFWRFHKFIEESLRQDVCLCLKDLTKATTSWKNIKEVQRIFQTFAQFELTEHDDVAFVNNLAIDYFILSRIHNVLDLLQTNLNFDVFLELINENTMDRLLEIIEDCCIKYETLKNDELIRKMLSKVQIKNYEQFWLLEKILDENPKLDTNLLDQLEALYMKYDYEFHVDYKIKIRNVKNYIEIILPIDAYKLGDARIECIYIQNHTPLWYLPYKLNAKIPSELQNELLKLNQNLYAKKSRYFPNSPEHILQTRIASLLENLRECDHLVWNDHLWHPILKQNNQCNVTIMYEYLIATTIETFTEITEKFDDIHNYTASQQVSLMSIAYQWQNYNPTENKLKIIVDMLLPLTMVAGFSTRLYAQLFIYKLLETPNPTESHNNVKKAIEFALGEKKLAELLHDVRIKLPYYHVNHRLFIADTINYITNAPFGEYFTPPFADKLKTTKDLFMRKLKNAAKLANENSSEFATPAPNTLTILNQSDSVTLLQRKVEPLQNLLTPHNLLAFSGIQNNTEPCTAADIYIIASLIDKLPNLGGIARTCEVLGLRNLVINKISDIEKPDFKNLSLTAEKYLNIIEIKIENLHKFLTQKQLEGYKVIGAEQVSHSTNFVNFKFPKKTIILLGHEKEGIPANLLGCLDFAVEIPQFGNVRSLNVHVTGALFMWEYCKQHIIK